MVKASYRIKNYLVWAAVLVALAVFVIYALKQKNKPAATAFYFWQQDFNLTESEQNWVDSLSIDKMYIKYFDVVWDAATKQAKPVAVVNFNKTCSKPVVPVVYITNEVFKKTEKMNIEKLYQNITKLLLEICNNLKPKEIQFDCDWSDNTAEKYFKFLRLFKADLRFNDVLLSTTIRLHQVKYKSRTGIPPADIGMLMFYNMGKLKNFETTNSIFNTNDAAKYVDFIDDYPLPLDYALPVFGWSVYFRNGKSLGILNDTYDTTLDTMSGFKQLAAKRYLVTKDQLYRGIYLKINDVIRTEFVDATLALQAANILKKSASHQPQTVALFHLNNRLLNTYEISDIKNLFDIYR